MRGLEALISSSPSLRKLELEGLIIPMVDVEVAEVVEQWVINAPNLQHLRIISSNDDGWHFSALPFLEVAEMTGLEGYYAEGRDFLKFISALDQARNLKLTMPVICFPSFPPRSLFLGICGLLADNEVTACH